MDERTEQLLRDYYKQVEQLARKLYLEAKSITRELNEAKINPEDRDSIKLHIINMISAQPQKEEQQQ